MTSAARPSRSELAREIRAVVHDVPTFLTAPLFRKWHLNWGATADEISAALPGDSMLAQTHYRSTRAITIDAPVHAVWPWLVQVGCGRAGFYSNDLLDNLGRPSADTIVPELQELRLGQRIPMSPSARHADRTSFEVHSFEVDSWLLWTKSDSTWAWRLTSAEGGTRLVTRIRGAYDWHHPLSALAGVVLMESGDFAMLRRMLRGIKTRAESLAHAAPVPEERVP